MPGLLKNQYEQQVRAHNIMSMIRNTYMSPKFTIYSTALTEMGSLWNMDLQLYMDELAELFSPSEGTYKICGSYGNAETT